MLVALTSNSRRRRAAFSSWLGRALRLLLGLLLGMTSRSAVAQTPTPGWTSAALVGDTAAANGTSAGARVVPDGQGGTWVMGTFQGRIHCGATRLSSAAGSVDVYLGRLTAAGVWQWAKSIGGPLLERGGDLVTDAAGNAYLTGSFQDSITIGAFQLTAQGLARTNCFVAKISPAGQWLWAAQGTGDALGVALAVEAITGTVVVAGSFGGVVGFGATTLATTTSQRLDRDIFLARLSATGQWLGASRAGGRRQDAPTALALDGAGHAVLTGTIASRSATFGAFTINNISVASAQVSTDIYADLFVAQYDLAAQQWLWAKMAGGGYDETADALAVSANGRITLAGTYNGKRYGPDSAARFGPFTLPIGGAVARPVYVAQLSAAGQWLRATAGADSSQTDVGGLVVDAAGEVTVSGAFYSQRARFGATALVNQGYVAPSMYSTYQAADLFVAHLSATGQWTWASAAGGTGLEAASGLCAEPATGALTLTGRFTGLPRFGTTTLLTVGGSGSAYVARLTLAGATRQWAWAVAPDAGGTTQVYDVALDAQGNALVVGRFSGRPWLGSHQLLPPNPAAALAGHLLFVAKRSPAGQWLWATPANQSTLYSLPPRLAVDPVSGDAYVSGALTGPATFGQIGIGTVAPGPTQYGDRTVLFVARISGAGQWQWAIAPSFSNYSQSVDLAVDPRGGLAVTGEFTDTLTLGATTLRSTGGGYSDGFVGRLSGFGQWLSVKKFGGRLYDNASEVVVDSTGAITVAGGFLRDFTLDSVFNYPAASFLGYHSFVARLSPTDQWQWLQVLAPQRQGGGVGITSMALDHAGNAVVAGWLTDTIHIGSSTLYAPSSSAGTWDGFVAKLSGTTRQWQWARQFGGYSGYNIINRIVLDAAGNGYVGGTFAGALRLGVSSLASVTTNGYTGLVAKISSAGAWRWGVASTNTTTSEVSALVVRAADQLLVLGNFTGSPLRVGATVLPGGYLEAGYLATTGLVLDLPAEAPDEAASLEVYPNPARGTATLRLPTAPNSARNAELVDALGRVARRFSLPAAETEVTLDLRALAPGLYVVRLTDSSKGAADGRHLSRRLVVE